MPTPDPWTEGYVDAFHELFGLMGEIAGEDFRSPKADAIEQFVYTLVESRKLGLSISNRGELMKRFQDRRTLAAS